jgi:hypothetical protein
VGGQISVLEPGGFGGVTISKAITIDGHYSEGGVLVSGTNAIVINAPSTAQVRLVGLDINGLGTGLNGIRILAAKSVKIEQTFVYGFTRNAIDFEPNIGNVRLVVNDSVLTQNSGVGVMVAPTPSAGTGAKATLARNVITENTCGVVATTFGPDPAFNFPNACGTAPGTSGVNASADVASVDNYIAFNSLAGVLSRGNLAINRIARNEITGNQFGLLLLGAGMQIISNGGNIVNGNGTDGAPTSTVPPI